MTQTTPGVIPRTCITDKDIEGEVQRRYTESAVTITLSADQAKQITGAVGDGPFHGVLLVGNLAKGVRPQDMAELAKSLAGSDALVVRLFEKVADLSVPVIMQTDQNAASAAEATGASAASLGAERAFARQPGDGRMPPAIVVD